MFAGEETAPGHKSTCHPSNANTNRFLIMPPMLALNKPIQLIL